jgi:hypothetical protein
MKHKEIGSFVKTLRIDYKLTLNDPDPIGNYLGIHFSHQDNGELHMSQTGLIDAVTESAHIPKGQLKNTPTPATSILNADTEGLVRQESWNYPSVIRKLNYTTLGQTYHSPFTNAHVSLKNRMLYMKKQSTASSITCNAQDTNH